MSPAERLARHLSRRPDTARAAFVARNATVVGDVTLGVDASVFYGAVLRGDIGRISVGDGSNIQDNAVVHLAGEPIAAGRWTEARKRSIRDSRTHGTAAVARAIARAERKPSVFVCASAIGYYGDRGETWVDERSAPGTGYLADVTTAWEDATVAARNAGVRSLALLAEGMPGGDAHATLRSLQELGGA